ncbi:MAG: cell wall metabolism sensor histidine kinase WalK [Chloroflexota bacterium]|nr:cell wall metabolism sensor histidine kinase WalK [Chloroflexota bacterium]
MLSRTWTRIALSYAVLVLITGGILALLLGGEFESREEATLRARLADQARSVAYEAAPRLAASAPATDTNQLAHDLGALFGTRVTLIALDGTVIGDSEETVSDLPNVENHAGRPEVVQALTQPGTVGMDSRLSVTVNRRLLYVAVAITDPSDPTRAIGVARVAYPLTSVEQAQNALWRNLLIAALLVSLPTALLGTLLARSIVGPLTTLREVAHRLGRGDLTARAPEPGGEIGELSREFNAMSDQLSSTIEQRTSERNQMAAVLSHMHDGILITDAQGHVEGINAAASRLLETPTDGATGHALIEVTHSHELHQALRNVLSERAGQQRLEVTIGRRKLAAVITAVPGESGSGGPTGLVVLQDVTELHRLERARRDFVANIGHELRTPLASIKLLVETLTHSVRDDPEATQDFLNRIDVEVDGLTQLVRELLELSRLESGQVPMERQAVDLPALLERAASRLRAQAERHDISIDVEAQSPLPTAYADTNRVEQVLVNLLHNAIKFNHPGGRITVRAEDAQDGWLRASVEDTGAGIPPDDLPRIFERFYKVDKARTGGREREGGTGLGLAVARHIVQAHGGRIWAESVYGSGSTFYFTLPTIDSTNR